MKNKWVSRMIVLVLMLSMIMTEGKVYGVSADEAPVENTSGLHIEWGEKDEWNGGWKAVLKNESDEVNNQNFIMLYRNGVAVKSWWDVKVPAKGEVVINQSGDYFLFDAEYYYALYTYSTNSEGFVFGYDMKKPVETTGVKTYVRDRLSTPRAEWDNEEKGQLLITATKGTEAFKVELWERVEEATHETTQMYIRNNNEAWDFNFHCKRVKTIERCGEYTVSAVSGSAVSGSAVSGSAITESTMTYEGREVIKVNVNELFDFEPNKEYVATVIGLSKEGSEKKESHEETSNILNMKIFDSQKALSVPTNLVWYDDSWSNRRYDYNSVLSADGDTENNWNNYWGDSERWNAFGEKVTSTIECELWRNGERYEYDETLILFAEETGDYTFRVRAIAEDMNNGPRNSNWSEFAPLKSYVRPTEQLGVPTGVWMDSDGILHLEGISEGDEWKCVVYCDDENKGETKDDRDKDRWVGIISASGGTTLNIYTSLVHNNGINAEDGGKLSVSLKKVSDNPNEVAHSEYVRFTRALFDTRVMSDDAIKKFYAAFDNEFVSQAVKFLTEKSDVEDLKEAIDTNEELLVNVKNLEDNYSKANEIEVEETEASEAVAGLVDVSEISTVGTVLNASKKDGDSGAGLCIDQAEEHGIDRSKYKDSVQLDIGLRKKKTDGTSSRESEIKIPITITMKAPKNFKIKDTEILHYHEDGITYETLIPKDNGDGTMSFSVSHFSDFIFAEKVVPDSTTPDPTIPDPTTPGPATPDPTTPGPITPGPTTSYPVDTPEPTVPVTLTPSVVPPKKPIVKVDEATGNETTFQEEKKVDEKTGAATIVKSEVVKDKEGKVVSESVKVEVELSADKMVDQLKNLAKSISTTPSQKPEADQTSDMDNKKEIDTVTLDIKLPRLKEFGEKAEISKITLPKAVLEAAEEANVNLEIEFKNDDGSTAYAWEFSPDGIKDKKEIGDIDLALTIRSATKEEATSVPKPEDKEEDNPTKTTSNDETRKSGNQHEPKTVDELVKDAVPEDSTAIVVSFGHSGALPGTATVKLNVSGIEGVKPGDSVTLYYVNPVAGKLEPLPDSTYTIDDKEFISLKIKHCSDYVLLTEKPAPETLYSPNVTFITRSRTLYIGEKTEFKINVEDYDSSTLLWYTTKRGIATVAKNKGKQTAVITAKDTGTENIRIRIQRSNGEWNNYYYKFTVKDKKAEEVITVQSEEAKTEYYTVQQGDSLWKISTIYGCTLIELVEWNKIKNPRLIFIGQKLIVRK